MLTSQPSAPSTYTRTGTKDGVVTITFKYTGTTTSNGYAAVYYGLYVAKPGEVPDQGAGKTNGANAWSGGSLQTTVDIGGSGATSIQLAPSAVIAGEISGLKFNDLNGNGTKDADEPGLAGWTICLDSDSDPNNGDLGCVLTANGTTDDLDGNGGSLGLLRGFAYLLSAAAGKTIFCDDTPRHVFFLDVILPQLPEAHVVACLRDPRDYLASYKYHWRRAREPERVRAIYHPVITSILWRRTWLAATGATGGEGRLILNRYEDLVTRPEEQVRRLCSFLDLDFHPDMLSIEGSNSSFGDGQRGVFTSSVGRFRAVLTAEETWACQRINAAGMGLLGYEPVVCRPNPLLRHWVV